jgi:hypothetical protein
MTYYLKILLVYFFLAYFNIIFRENKNFIDYLVATYDHTRTLTLHNYKNQNDMPHGFQHVLHVASTNAQLHLILEMQF